MVVSVSVRRFADRDFEDYVKTLLLTWPFDSIVEARENASTAVEKAHAAVEKSELWVAELDGIAAGFMLLEFSSNLSLGPDDTGCHSVEIDWLDIHPTFQGKGAGAALVRKAEERARVRQCESMTIHTSVSNLGMLRLAERCGFANKERLKDFWGTGSGDAFLLVKRLNPCHGASP
jgi:ribosomal protein S18 acetylase RimI-like enzyme